MRVVFDTNVLMAAHRGRGTCYDVVKRLFYDLRYMILTSQPLVDELHEKLMQKFDATKVEADRSIAELTDRARWVVPIQLPMDSCRDPDDVVVLGTAVAGRADCIITGDKDLLVLKSFRGIDIIPPGEFQAY